MGVFKVRGSNIKAIRVEVFNLAGKRVFQSDEVARKTLRWHLQDSQGRPLANGVYLYVVTIKGLDGRTLREVDKLVLKR